MLLSNTDLEEYIKDGRIKVTPEAKISDIQPASIDLHLGPTGLMFKAHKPKNPWDTEPVFYIDPGIDQAHEMGKIIFPAREQAAMFLLGSHEFALGYINESITVPYDLCAFLHGCSGLARYGLFIHVNAGLLDPDWGGNATLEIFNASPHPIRLWYGMRIGTVTYQMMRTPSNRPYGHKSRKSKYQGDDTVVSSRYHQDLLAVV